ncbi:MAG: FtsW/RodA/SpoVE family cell cycle protein [Planctomycetota bacterium]|nr:FtsW/RodA/SpoVE family cell cycle protein [Planctomycetota bacterium]
MFGWLRTYLRGVSWPIIIAMAALMVISILAVRVAEDAAPSDPLLRGSTVRQMIYVLVGALGFIIATIIPYQRIGQSVYLFFALNLVLLVLVLFLPANRNSHRWINLKFFMVQPSELAKLTYILALAWYLRYRDNYRRFFGLLVPFMLTIIPAALILIEPDLGTTLLLFPALFVMLFLAGAKLRHLLAIVVIAVVVIFFPVPRNVTGKSPSIVAERKVLAYWHGSIGGEEYVISAAPLAIMKHHQLSRIEGWLMQPDPLVEVSRQQGFQLHNSMIILGSGRMTGQDILDQKNLYFRMLPDDHTDFIYAVIGGEWGFMGCVGVLFIYLAIFFCGAEIAGTTDDPFGRLVVVGVLGLLLAQVLINVGMTMGLAPITGMTLPMVSYGGSSMLVNCVAMGLLINVAQRRPILLGPKPFEYGRKRLIEPASYGPLFERE